MSYVDIIKAEIAAGRMTRRQAERWLIRQGMFADKVQELLDAK